MTTRLFIEGNEIDLIEDFPIDLNFSIADIREFSKRSTSFSKTIKVPATNRNKKIFGHIYEIGSSNEYDENVPNVNLNFNPTKRAIGKLYENNILVFDGVIRLISVEDIFGNMQFEINLFGRAKDLFFELKEKTLNELDLNFMNIPFDMDAIYYSSFVDKWLNDTELQNIAGPLNFPVQNMTFPLIDFGLSVDMQTFPIANFKPCVFLRQLWDEIHKQAGFEYDAPFVETDFFKHLILVKGDKNVKISKTGLISSKEDFNDFGFSDPVSNDWSTTVDIPFSANVNNLFFLGGGNVATYKPTQKFKGTLKIRADEVIVTNQILSGWSIFIEKSTNGAAPWNVVGSLDFSDPGSNTYLNPEISVAIELETNNAIRFRYGGGGQDSGGTIAQSDIQVTNAQFFVESEIAQEFDLIEGTEIVVQDILPKNIKQREFIQLIIQMFNFYVIEDKDIPKKLKYIPFPFFYDNLTSNGVDWTEKLDRSKPIVVKPIGELIAREFSVTYSNDSDFWSEQYRKIFSREYGEYTFTNSNEFELEKKQIKILTGAPLMRQETFDRVMLHLYKSENNIKKSDSFKPRVAYYKTQVPTATNWFVQSQLLPGPTNLFGLFYPYAGHLDDPYNPTIDILFGRPEQIYFSPPPVYPETSLCDAFYRSLFERYSDKDAKVVTAYFNLDAIDIQTLNFARLIRVGNNYFILQSVEEYAPNGQSLAKVTLVKINTGLQIQELNFILLEDGFFMLQENNTSKFYI